MSKKVAFVTPRYGPQIMGGAETAARQLAEHLRAQTDWEAEVHTTCALDPHHLGRRPRARDDRRSTASPCTGIRSAHGRLPDFYGLDGTVRLAPRMATREQGERWVDYNGPVSPELVDAVCASDADVVAFYPYLYHPTVADHRQGAGCRPCSTRPRTTSRRSTSPCSAAPSADADAFCFHTAAERALVERMYPVAERPQIVLGLGVGDSEGTGRPGGELLGLGDRPYVVSVGRVDEHKGSKMLASYFATYKERHPGPLALALVGPVSVRAAAAPRHRRDGRRRRGRQVGHRARRPGGGLPLGARVLLAGGDRSLGRPGSGPGQRRLRADA